MILIHKEFKKILTLTAIMLLILSMLILSPNKSQAAGPQLLLRKIVDKTSVMPGQSFTYSIQVRCASLTENCDGVTISDNTPGITVYTGGMSKVSYSPSGGLIAAVTSSGSNTTWTTASSIPAGSTITLQLTFSVNNSCFIGPNGTVTANTVSISNATYSKSASSPTVAITPNATSCEPSPPPAPAPTPDWAVKSTNTTLPTTSGAESDWTVDLYPGTFTVEDELPDSSLHLISFGLRDATVGSWNGGPNMSAQLSCDGGLTWGNLQPFDNSPPSSVPNLTSLPSSLSTSSGVNGCAFGPPLDGSSVINTLYSATGNKLKIRMYHTMPLPPIVVGIGRDIVAYRTLSDKSFPTNITTLQNCITSVSGFTASDLDTSTPQLKSCVNKPVQAGTYVRVGKDQNAAVTTTRNYGTSDFAPTSITLNPGQVGYDLYFNINTGDQIVNPVYSDLLPPELDYLPSSDNFIVDADSDATQTYPYENVDLQPGCNNPVFERIPNWNNSGRTLLRWSFNNCIVGPWREAGGIGSQIHVYYSATLKPGIAASTPIHNQYLLTQNDPGIQTQFSPTCHQAIHQELANQSIINTGNWVDGVDFDGDGNTTENVCGSSIPSFTVPKILNAQSAKFVNGANDPAGYESRYPGVGSTSVVNNGDGTFSLYIANYGNTDFSTLDLVDILPHVGDTSTLDPNQLRDSDWSMQLKNNITVDFLDQSLADGNIVEPWNQDWSNSTSLTSGSDYIDYYSSSTNPCRLTDNDGVAIYANNLGPVDSSGPAGTPLAPSLPSGCDASPWGSSAIGAKSFGLEISKTIQSPNPTSPNHGDMIKITIPAEAVTSSLPPAGSRNGKIAWNSFAYSANDSTGLLSGELAATEPLKAGLMLVEGTSALGDTIWFDADHDGIQDPTESGIAGVTVNLYDATGTTLIASAITDSNGLYFFNGLTPNTNYAIKLNNPDDYIDGGPLFGSELTLANTPSDDTKDSDATIVNSYPTINGSTLAADTSNPTFDFGFWKPASLGDYVWFDTNKNGLQDYSETGVSGVVVNLYTPGLDGIAGTADDILIGSDTTDSSGKYLFDNLISGEYFVEFITPLGQKFTVGENTGNDANDSDADSTTGLSPIYTIQPGDNILDVDAGLINIPTDIASVGDYVWADDGDGIQEPSETGVEGVTVVLLDSSGFPVATTQTDADGKYLFENLTPGTYSIQFYLPDGTIFTPKTQGGDTASDSDANTTTGITSSFTLSANENLRDIDAGIITPASLGNYIWVDSNHDGIQQLSETGVPGVVVTLYKPGADGLAGTPDDILVSTDTTDTNGYYLFENLSASEYFIKVDPPTGYGITLDNEGGDSLDSDINPTTHLSSIINLSLGENNLTLDVGIFEAASLGNFIWYDGDKASADGNQSSNIGVSGVKVELYTPGPDGLAGTTDDVLVTTDTTDATGAYLFENLVPGQYFIKVISPSGTELTLQNNIGDDTLDSDVDISTGLSQIVTLNGGDNNLTLDAGITTQGQIALEKQVKDPDNTTWYDADTSPGVAIKYNSQADFRFVITNPTSTPLTNIILNDQNYGLTNCPSNQSIDITQAVLLSDASTAGNGDTKLDSNEQIIITGCTLDNVYYDFENVANVSAELSDNNGNPLETTLGLPDGTIPLVTDTNSAFVRYVSAGIRIEKTPEIQTLPLDVNYVDFTLQVTHSSSIPELENIVVTDTLCDIAPAYLSGDTDSDSKLDLNETWLYSCRVSKPLAGWESFDNIPDFPYDQTWINTASVKGSVPTTDSNGNPLPQIDDVTNERQAYVIHSDLTVSKKVREQGSDVGTGSPGPWEDVETIRTGENVDWQITISNTGSLPIENVVIDEDQCPSLTGPSQNIPLSDVVITGDNGSSADPFTPGVGDGLTSLWQGETWVITCSSTNLTTNLTNTVKVNGNAIDLVGSGTTDLSGQASASANVVDPHVGIKLEILTASGWIDADSLTGSEGTNNGLAAIIASGDNVEYKVTIYNANGNATDNNGLTLTNINANVTLPDGTIVPISVASLAPGASTVITKTDYPALEISNVTTSGIATATITSVAGSTLAGEEFGSVKLADNVLDINDTDTANFLTANIELKKYVIDINGVEQDAQDGTSAPTFEESTALTYRFKVTNTGQTPLGNVALEDAITSCLPTIISNGNNNNILDIGEVWIYECQKTDGITTNFRNLATVTADPIDVSAPTTAIGSQLSDTDEANASTTPKTDLAISKKIVGSNTNLLINSNVSYEITLTNQSDIKATNVQITDTLPTQLQFVSTTNSGVNTGQNISWNIPEILPNTSITMTVEAKIVQTGTITNKVEIIAADQKDIDSTPNNALVTEDDISFATITVNGDISLNKKLTYAENKLNGTAKWTITITSKGNYNDDLTIKDTLPPELEYIKYSGDASTCSNQGKDITCIVSGGLLDGQTKSIVIETKIISTKSTSIKNTAYVLGINYTEDTTNNTSNDTLTFDTTTIPTLPFTGNNTIQIIMLAIYTTTLGLILTKTKKKQIKN